MDIINPATEELITTLEEDSVESLAIKLDQLRNGAVEWRRQALSERLACINRFAELILGNIDELAFLLTSETGKPIQQSFNEIRGAQNRIDHLNSYAEKWLSDEILVASGDTQEMIKYEPLGVIANISAWNFPYNVGYNVFLYALVAGNAVFYKPSEYASLTGRKFGKYLLESGIPENVFRCVIGGVAVGQQLLEMNLDGYFFTGSYATGIKIAQSVTSKLVPLQLELGGKDPLYVIDDITDINQAAINAAEGAFYNNGQSCCAVERIYVAERIYQTFVSEFVTEVKSFKIGDPKDMGTFIGSLTRQQQINVLNEQVADAQAKGARVLCGGKAIEGKGYYYQPTVLVDVNHSMRIMQEESFGPIIGIQQVKSDEEAVQLMSDTQFGLTAAVFSNDQQRALNIFEQINTGTVYWNCCDRVSPNIPWSGRKHSGLGSTLSSQGIRAFVQPKSYHLRSN